MEEYLIKKLTIDSEYEYVIFEQSVLINFNDIEMWVDDNNLKIKKEDVAKKVKLDIQFLISKPQKDLKTVKVKIVDDSKLEFHGKVLNYQLVPDNLILKDQVEHEVLLVQCKILNRYI